MQAKKRFLDRLTVPITSCYLLACGAWLLATEQIPPPGFKRILRAGLRRPYSGELSDIPPDEGFGWLAPVPPHLLSDMESSSLVVLFENGQPLGPAHVSHAEIRARGGGRYSHWGADLYFSTSDNSDPRSNGRRYSLREVR
jgi:hypothetical protein